MWRRGARAAQPTSRIVRCSANRITVRRATDNTRYGLRAAGYLLPYLFALFQAAFLYGHAPISGHFYCFAAWEGVTLSNTVKGHRRKEVWYVQDKIMTRRFALARKLDVSAIIAITSALSKSSLPKLKSFGIYASVFWKALPPPTSRGN